MVFRVDASLHIGSGHVMRCLTLATALREKGAHCHFICRAHPGNLVDHIRSKGFQVTQLPSGNPDFAPAVGSDGPEHAPWLGADWTDDAEATCEILRHETAQWLIVDHYALDHRWEHRTRLHCEKLMVLDDLADRIHDCDLLLDQNLGRDTADYAGLVPTSCTKLIGTQYALLRSEFAALREYSLARRKPAQLRRLLVTMGGMDRNNATGQVLDTLQYCALPEDCQITVVMGLHAPWLAQVRAQAAKFPWPCEVKVNASDMAQLMADSDLAIGAAGGTSWERCVLALPTLIVILAGNQQNIATALEDVYAAALVDLSAPETITKWLRLFMQHPHSLLRMSASAAQIADGCGLQRVINVLRQGEMS